MLPNNMLRSQNIFGRNFQNMQSCVMANGKGKWYALIGKITKIRLGLQEEGTTDFINLKCPPDMVSILQQSPNFLPAYHMNKTHWLTIVLDHGVETEEIFKLLDWSYDLTK